MNQTSATSLPKETGATHRIDDWQRYPLVVGIGFALFGIYATLRAFENQWFEVGNLLTPFYSPLLDFNWTILEWRVSPALLILPIPLLFRATCYYYRKAYYRAFSLNINPFNVFSPRACGVVGKADPNYKGETGLFAIQNIHRYAFYLASVVLAILWWDALATLFAGGHFFDFRYLQVSLGTIVFFANVYLLSGYTFGCHACRHLVGGGLNSFTAGEQARTSMSLWQRVTTLNEKHEAWAWASLVSVGFADFYTRAVAINANANGPANAILGFINWPDPIFFSMHQ